MHIACHAHYKKVYKNKGFGENVCVCVIFIT